MVRSPWLRSPRSFGSLSTTGTSPNAADENTYTPMHAAASWGHVEVLRYLQQKGGNINLTDEDGECVFTADLYRNDVAYRWSA